MEPATDADLTELLEIHETAKCGLALSALHAQLPRRRGSPCRAWARHLLRNRPELGAEVRTGDRAAVTGAPSSPERSMAPRRDGCSDRRQADVPLACR